MKKILSIARYTLIENILILFGVIIIGASLLLAALSGEQQQRLLLDLGFSAIEFFALLTIVFGSVTLILEELESKTIYLILTRPLSRGAYLIGRFAGLLAAVYCGMLIMSGMHLGILFLKGWAFTARYPLALLLSAEKITLIGSVALFFSLFSSSAISSISFTLFFWIIGHFSEELHFLSAKLTYIVPQMLAKAAYYLAPNLQYFNLRDFWDVPHIAGSWIGAASLYGILYSSFCVALAILFFRKREF